MKRSTLFMSLFLCGMLAFSSLNCSNEPIKNVDDTSKPAMETGMNSLALMETGSDYSVFWKGEKSYPYEIETVMWKKADPFDGRDGEIYSYVDVEYPKINGMPDNGVQEKVNHLITNCIVENIVRHHDYTGFEFDVYTFVNYKVMLLTEDYLSILFDGTSQCGKINRQPKVLNINLLTGEKLEIEDFFLSDVDAANLVMDYCKTDLTSQYEEYYVESIGEQFSMLIDWGCTKHTCSNVNLTNDGFYLIFDDLFSRAEGRWVVHAPYNAFGDSCILNEFKDAYGFFSLPIGWSYIYPPFPRNCNDDNHVIVAK